MAGRNMNLGPGCVSVKGEPKVSTEPPSGISFYNYMHMTDTSPILCIECGTIIAQYEHYSDGHIESWGYRDTIERIGSADSLRCGRCYERRLLSYGHSI